MPRLLSLALFGGLAMTIFGCGDAGPRLYEVEGSVLWEGSPIIDGYIIFYPIDNGRDADTSLIEYGHFSLKTMEGVKRVEITAQRPIPGSKNPLGGPDMLQYIPPKFNRESKLEVIINPEGENQFDFELKAN